MYQIASVNPNHFMTVGNYGAFWVYNRASEGIWDIVEKNLHKHAHFALEVYDQELEYYIANNYNGDTRILDKYGSKIAKLYGFGSNLQNMAILPDLITAVDYFGNSHIYSKSKSDDKKYINIQTIDCICPFS